MMLKVKKWRGGGPVIIRALRKPSVIVVGSSKGGEGKNVDPGRNTGNEATPYQNYVSGRR